MTTQVPPATSKAKWRSLHHRVRLTPEELQIICNALRHELGSHHGKALQLELADLLARLTDNRAGHR